MCTHGGEKIRVLSFKVWLKMLSSSCFRPALVFMCSTKDDSRRKFCQSTLNTTTWQALFVSSTCVSENFLPLYSQYQNGTCVTEQTSIPKKQKKQKKTHVQMSICGQTVSVRWWTLSRVAWWSLRETIQSSNICTFSKAMNTCWSTSRGRYMYQCRHKTQWAESVTVG